MNLDDGAIQRHRLHLDSHNLFALQLLKNRRNHALFAPTIHVRIDAVPSPKAIGQSSPFASLLGHIQNRIEHLEILNLHVSTLLRKAFRHLFKLLRCQFPSCFLCFIYQVVN